MGRVNLVEAGLQEEAAERSEACLGARPAAVVVIPALGIRRGQRLEVAQAMACESARRRPEPMAAHARAAEVGIRVQSCHMSVAVEEGMDPQQSMMTGRRRHYSVEALESVRIAARQRS